MLLLLALALVVLPDVYTASPYGDEDEDEDEDEELLVVGDHRDSDENERLEGLHDAAGGAPAPPTPTSEIEDPLKGIIDAALNSPAIFAQRLKVNFGELVSRAHAAMVALIDLRSRESRNNLLSFCTTIHIARGRRCGGNPLETGRQSNGSSEGVR